LECIEAQGFFHGAGHTIFPEHIKIRLYLIIIIKSTMNHDYNYMYIDLRTVVQKVFISCSGKKTNTNIRYFGKKHEYPNMIRT
jgi:hypothetical protein